VPTFLAACVLASLLAWAPSSAAADAAAPDAALAAKRAWVEQVERDDYFFWSRYFRRLEARTEFPQPDDWYLPNALVEGEPSPPPPLATPAQRAIDAASWAAAADWAFARNTQVLVAMRDGRIEWQRWAPDVHAGRLLPVRSFAKTLPALLVGVAVAEGRLASVDAPLSTWLPEWRDDPRGAITLRQVLSMSSGLATVPLKYTPDEPQIRLAEGGDVHGTALDWPLAGPPDARFAVNQVDTQLLALVLERATGERYERYLSSRLWRPLGNGTATMNTDGPRGHVRAFCCMRSGLHDWLRVGELVRLDGRVGDREVVPADWLARMRAPSPANPYAGLHLFVGWAPGTPEAKADGRPLQVPHAAPYLAPDVVYLMGGGYMTVWVVPSRGLTILRWGTDSPDWDHSRIPNLLIAAVDRAAAGAR
jgi:CubicO group peptidase (beta-lactamase class C family)